MVQPWLFGRGWGQPHFMENRCSIVWHDHPWIFVVIWTCVNDPLLNLLSETSFTLKWHGSCADRSKDNSSQRHLPSCDVPWKLSNLGVPQPTSWLPLVGRQISLPGPLPTFWELVSDRMASEEEKAAGKSHVKFKLASKFGRIVTIREFSRISRCWCWRSESLVRCCLGNIWRFLNQADEAAAEELKAKHGWDLRLWDFLVRICLSSSSRTIFSSKSDTSQCYVGHTKYGIKTSEVSVNLNSFAKKAPFWSKIRLSRGFSLENHHFPIIFFVFLRSCHHFRNLFHVFSMFLRKIPRSLGKRLLWNPGSPRPRP